MPTSRCSPILKACLVFFSVCRRFRLIGTTSLHHKVKHFLWTVLMPYGIPSVLVLEFHVACPKQTNQLFRHFGSWVLLMEFCHSKEFLRNQTYWSAFKHAWICCILIQTVRLAVAPLCCHQLSCPIMETDVPKNKLEKSQVKERI